MSAMKMRKRPPGRVAGHESLTEEIEIERFRRIRCKCGFQTPFSNQKTYIKELYRRHLDEERGEAV